jgi:Glu-tRNA(Gln) amidotransferase subunit E-like FAD-binding protein
METKKNNIEKSKVLQSISGTAQLISKNDGNRDTTEQDIIDAVKRELKMAIQSKESGAPFNPQIFPVSEEFLPKIMNEQELTKTITIILQSLINDDSDKTPKLMGSIMKILKSDFKDLYDGKMASQLTKALLN